MSHEIRELRALIPSEIVPLPAAALERALAESRRPLQALAELEEPFVVRSDPYDESKPVDSPALFFGRRDPIRRISSALRQGQHAGVFGVRKVGKSSLLFQIRDRVLSVPTIWVDCQAFAPVAFDLFAEILNQLRTELRRLLQRRIPEVWAHESANDFRRAFLELFELWRRYGSGERVVVMFDEIDKFFPDRERPGSKDVLREYVTLFQRLRGLAQEQGCLSLLVVSYRPDVNRQNLLTEDLDENPMYGSYQEVFLGYLGEDDTRAMIREIGSWREISWDAEALDQVVRLTGGHPLLARWLASEACEQGELKHATWDAVDAAASEIRRGFHRHRLGRYFDESIWRFLRPAERQILTRAAVGSLTRAGVPEKLEDALANLQNFGLVSGDPEALTIQGDLLREWVERNHGHV